MHPGELEAPGAFPGKPEARAWARGLLRSVDTEARAERSAAAAARVESLEAFRSCDLLLVFLSMPTEIDTSAVIRAAIREGKRAAAPRMEGGEIVFASLDEYWESLPRDAMGIPTPPEGRALSQAELVRSGAFALVPGLLFDGTGRRLGRGRGYYDRFLAAMLAAMAARDPGASDGFFVPCGFCYEVQVVPRVPTARGDMRVPLVVTDAAVRRCGEA